MRRSSFGIGRLAAAPPRRRLPAPGLIAVLALALALRLLWIARVHPAVALTNDAGFYDFFGQSIASGRGYIMPDGEPTAFWPPGYPASLALLYSLFGHRVEAATLFNCLADSATAGLVYLLARRWVLPRPALLAALVYTLLPGPITFTSLTLSEPWFTCLLTAALALMAWADVQRDRWWWPLAFGLVAAAAVYVRGQALLLPLLACVWLLASGDGVARSLRFGAIALGVIGLATLPWAVRNSRVFGEPAFLSTNLGQDFWTGHHEGADGGLAYQDQVAFAAHYERLPRRERERAINRDGLRQGVDYMRTHPGDEARLLLAKLVRLYRDDLDGIRWNEQHGAAPVFSPAARSAVRAGVTIGYWLALALALLSLAGGWKQRAPWAVFCTLVIAAWTAVHLLFFAEPRFHAPVLPLVAVAAGVALAPLAARGGMDGSGDRAASEQGKPAARPRRR